jgi:hypothetical protein
MSRVDSRQRKQNAWKNGQPIRVAVHYPARLRYGRVPVEDGDSHGAEECNQGEGAKPARLGDCCSKISTAESRCWWHEYEEQCTMDSRASCRAAATYFALRNSAAIQGTERTELRLAQSRIMLHGEACQGLSRTVCTVLQLFLETKCHVRWVRSYMRPTRTRSCT